MFKKSLKYIIVILTFFAFSNCDNQLDLAPEDKIVEDKVFAKEKSAEGALVGTYNLMFEAFKTFYKLADQTTWTVSDDGRATFLLPFYEGTLTANDGFVLGIWQAHYKAINQANMLIYKIDKLGKYNEQIKKQHIAESRFIRAWSYLNLLMWFGNGALQNKENELGVVLYLDHYDGFDKKKDIRPRNTNGEIFDQIIKDLEESIIDLPEAHPTRLSNVARANKYNASALLSKVYLIQKNYQKAIEYASIVLNNPNYKLETNLLKVFPPNPNDAEINFSGEHLFAFPVSSNGGNWQFGGNNIYYYYANYWFSDILVDIFDETDLRLQILTKKMQKKLEDGVVKTVFITEKYPSKNGRDNLTIMRLPEVMLIKAEAILHQNKTLDQEAISLLNKVYLRANPQADAIKTEDFEDYKELLDRILEEKAKELCWEGSQRFDDIRTGRKLSENSLPDAKKILPIPQREIDISEGVIKQNPTY